MQPLPCYPKGLDTARLLKSRQGKSRGPRTLRSVNSRPNHLNHLAPPSQRSQSILFWNCTAVLK
ncbi:hypothetical protein T265_14737, partial [Opisthorchis viverrini]